MVTCCPKICEAEGSLPNWSAGSLVGVVVRVPFLVFLLGLAGTIPHPGECWRKQASTAYHGRMMSSEASSCSAWRCDDTEVR